MMEMHLKHVQEITTCVDCCEVRSNRNLFIEINTFPWHHRRGCAYYGVAPTILLTSIISDIDPDVSDKIINLSDISVVVDCVVYETSPFPVDILV